MCKGGYPPLGNLASAKDLLDAHLLAPLDKSAVAPSLARCLRRLEFDVARKDCHTLQSPILDKKLEKSPKTAYTRKEWKTCAEVSFPDIPG